MRNDVQSCLKEAISICEAALKNIHRQRMWYLLISFLLVIPLLCSMGFDYLLDSVEASIGFNLIRLFLTALLCYFLFMSSLWNLLEKNALKAGCSAMEVQLMKMTKTLENSCNR